MVSAIVSVDDAFASAPTLRKRIYSLIEQEPKHSDLFADIGHFILSSSIGTGDMANGNGHADGPPSKKRRIEEGSGGAAGLNPGPGTLVFEARDISFSLPSRKKLHLGLVEHQPSANGGKSFSIQLRNPGTNQVESMYALEQYSHVLRLSIPEKNQKQYNFCLIPAAQYSGTTEPMIWTINDGPLKSYKIESDEIRDVAPGPNDVLESILNHALKSSNTQIVLPTGEEFVSAIRESHRKGDLSYHVKAFRGSKEGYLFFLENGVFFGFKKPLVFFSFDDIESISYTSVLQRTFNLNVTAKTAGDLATQEIEFSMLDQQDFAGIDDYIKRHQLQDASLAEARRAKKSGKGAKNTEAGEQVEPGELEKAQAEMEDEEDELEEDYDPDEEEGDSDSGSESGDEEYTVGKGRNLLAEELGSEAEDVSLTEDEEDEDEVPEESEAPKVKTQKVQKLPTEQKRSTGIPTHSGRTNLPTAPDLDDDEQL